MKVRARHILVPTLNEAVELHSKIAEGEDFAVVARKFSKCPSGQNGGDLGEFGQGQMVKPFEDATFSLELNQLSQLLNK